MSSTVAPARSRSTAGRAMSSATPAPSGATSSQSGTALTDRGKHAAAGTALVVGGLGLGTVVTQKGPARTGELALDTTLSHEHFAPLVDAARGIDVLIGPLAGPTLVAVIAAWLFIRHRTAAIVFALSTAALWLATSAFKIVFARPRPAASGIHALVHETARDSFPSGHTALAAAVVAGAFFTARMLGRSTRLVLALGLPFVAIVAASRLYLGAHFLGDVTASAIFVAGFALIGAALAPLVTHRSLR